MSDDDLDYDLDGPMPPRVAAHATATGPEGYASPVVNWRELDTADAGAIWEELDEWVRWARYRYDLRMLQPCWYKHPLVVEQLSALHTAWTVLFSAEDSGLGPVTFLEKVHVAGQVLRPAIQGCSRDACHFVDLRGWPSPEVDNAWQELTR